MSKGDSPNKSFPQSETVPIPIFLKNRDESSLNSDTSFSEKELGGDSAVSRYPTLTQGLQTPFGLQGGGSVLSDSSFVGISLGVASLPTSESESSREGISQALQALKKEGVILDFSRNPQIKHTSNLDSGATTEHPAKVGFTRDYAVVYVDGEENRVKMIKYGNFNAMHEVLAQKLYALTGLRSPETKLMIGLDGVFVGAISGKKDAKLNKEKAIPNLYVSSPVIPGYQDLGDFLLNGSKYFVSEENKEVLRGLVNKISSLSKDSKIEADEKKTKSLECFFKIYELLPDYVHDEIEKAFAASKFVSNWDFANFDLKNIGCRFLLEEGTNKPIKFESVFVDFGNSGVLGFGGNVKKLSFERANSEAKPKDKSSADFDPALKFSKDEENFLISLGEKNLQKHVLDDKSQHHAKALALNARLGSGESRTAEDSSFLLGLGIEKFSLSESEEQKKQNPGRFQSIQFKLAHHIRDIEADHKISSMVGLLSFSDLPRNLPFSQLFRGVVAAKTEAVISAVDDVMPDSWFFDKATSESCIAQEFLQKKPWVDSEIEMAFRLSLIKDETIHAIVSKWNLSTRFPDIFLFPENFPDALKSQYSSQKLTEDFIARKNHLVASVPREVVNEWVYQNGLIAFAAENSVLLENLRIVGKSVKLVEENCVKVRMQEFVDHAKEELPKEKHPFYLESEVQEKEVRARVMLSEISKMSFSKVYDESIKTLESSIEALKKIGGMEGLIALAENEKNSLEQKKTEAVLQGIEAKSSKWRKMVCSPNCDFFKIEVLREIYRELHGGSQLKDGIGIRDSKENAENNARRDAENKFVLERFKESLRACDHAGLSTEAQIFEFRKMVPSREISK